MRDKNVSINSFSKQSDILMIMFALIFLICLQWCGKIGALIESAIKTTKDIQVFGLEIEKIGKEKQVMVNQLN